MIPIIVWEDALPIGPNRTDRIDSLNHRMRFAGPATNAGLHVPGVRFGLSTAINDKDFMTNGDIRANLGPLGLVIRFDYSF